MNSSPDETLIAFRPQLSLYHLQAWIFHVWCCSDRRGRSIMYRWRSLLPGGCLVLDATWKKAEVKGFCTVNVTHHLYCIAQAPGQNPRRHRENIHTPHRTALTPESNQGPSCCEAMVPMCRTPAIKIIAILSCVLHAVTSQVLIYKHMSAVCLDVSWRSWICWVGLYIKNMFISCYSVHLFSSC